MLTLSMGTIFLLGKRFFQLKFVCFKLLFLHRNIFLPREGVFESPRYILHCTIPKIHHSMYCSSFADK